MDILNTRIGLEFNEEKITKLYTHNRDVDHENNLRLADIKAELKTFTANTSGNPSLVETLKKNILAKEITELKVGARVMFVKNNARKGYVNGSMGEVIKFNKAGVPVVKLVDGAEIHADYEILDRDWET